MLNFLFKKEQVVESLIYEYLDTLSLSQKNFIDALESCLQNGYLCETFDFLIIQTHKYKSKADDIREEIKTMMYGKALIPESRGDIMGLLEQTDFIPRIYERILYMIQTQRLEIPDFHCSLDHGTDENIAGML